MCTESRYASNPARVIFTHTRGGKASGVSVRGGAGGDGRHARTEVAVGATTAGTDDVQQCTMVAMGGLRVYKWSATEVEHSCRFGSGTTTRGLLRLRNVENRGSAREYSARKPM